MGDAGASRWDIAFLRRHFSPTGGAEKYLIRLAGGLQQAGHRVTLYCESWDSSETPFQAVVKVPASDPDSFSRAIRQLDLRQRHSLVFASDRVADVDLFRAGDGVHAEWLRARLRASPFMGAVRTWLRPKNRALCRLEAEVFDPARTGRVICNSRMVSDQIKNRFGFPPKRLDLIRNGVSFPLFSSGDRARGRAALNLSSSDYVVLLVGAGRERKGHDLARRMVRQSGTSARLLIVDRPPPVEMPDVYAAADVFLLPTLYDPFANVTLEALAAGLPVMTTSSNGASEILTSGKNGLILDGLNPLAHGAEWIQEFASPEVRRRYFTPAQELARQFTLERNLSETLEAFAKVKRG